MKLTLLFTHGLTTSRSTEVNSYHYLPSRHPSSQPSWIFVQRDALPVARNRKAASSNHAREPFDDIVMLRYTLPKIKKKQVGAEGHAP